jgi:uncharacterized protein YbjT (DUF2867 family)
MLRKTLLITLTLISCAATADVLVLGGTRNTGYEVVRLLKQQGTDVTSLARETSDTSKLEALGVPTVTGDLLDAERMQEIFAENQFDTVISTFGSSFKTKVKPDFTGNKYAIDGAVAGGVKQYVLITMVGVGDTYNSLEPKFQKIFTEQIDMKGRAEEYLKASGLDYTIYRAGGLYTGHATETGIITQDPTIMGVIARRELARIIVTGLNDTGRSNQTYTAIDPKIAQPDWDGKSQTSGMPEEVEESELD